MRRVIIDLSVGDINLKMIMLLYRRIRRMVSRLISTCVRAASLSAFIPLLVIPNPAHPTLSRTHLYSYICKARTVMTELALKSVISRVDSIVVVT
jgi:hypothetical protein